MRVTLAHYTVITVLCEELWFAGRALLVCCRRIRHIAKRGYNRNEAAQWQPD